MNRIGLLPLLALAVACQMPQLQKLDNPFDAKSPNYSAKAIIPQSLATFADDGQILVTWEGVDNATSYNLYWSTAAGPTPATGTKVSATETSAPLTGLTNGTTYYFVVTAVSMGVESQASEAVSAVPTALPAKRGTILGFIGSQTMTPGGGTDRYADVTLDLSGSGLSQGDVVTLIYAGISDTSVVENWRVHVEDWTTQTRPHISGFAVHPSLFVAGEKFFGSLDLTVTEATNNGGLKFFTRVPDGITAPVVVDFTKLLAFRNLQGRYTAVTGVTLPTKSLLLIAGGATGTLPATVSPLNASTNQLSWSTSDTKVATVAADEGVVTPVGAGTSTIKGLSMDGGFSDTATVTVLPSLAMVASPEDGTVNLSWTAVSAATSYNVYYAAGSTADKTSTKLAATALSGTSAAITGLTNGTAYALVVTAVTADGESQPSAVAKCTPAVQKKATPVAPIFTYTGAKTLNSDGISWNAQFTGFVLPSESLAISDTITVVYSVTSDRAVDGPLQVELQNTSPFGSVCDTFTLVNPVPTGQVFAGTVSLSLTGTARTPYWNFHTAKPGVAPSGSMVLTFAKFLAFKNLDGAYVALTSVTMAPKTLTLTAGGATSQLSATLAPANATDNQLIWSSSNTTVATVDAAGKVTPKAKGTAVIKALSMDGGLSDTCTVTVE